MAVDPSRTPGTFGAPPAHAPHEVSQAEDPVALALRAAAARANERSLKPLVFETQTQKPPVGQPPIAVTPKPIAPSQSRLRTPGQTKPPITTPAESVAAPVIVLTDAPSSPLPAPAPAPTPVPAVAYSHETETSSPLPHIERPAVDAATAAHLASPLAEAARKLAAQRAVTHQPAASDSDSPARGVPTPSADPGKQITGGFGDAGDAQYFPLDGSELRELVRGLMSVIDAQIENDLRFSMAITYPRVSARVVVEISAYAAGGDGGQYDPSFTIAKVMPEHDKTPIEIARQRADQVVFVVVADRVEMSAHGESLSPPNQIREELGLIVPRKQAISTPQGRLIVDLRA
jgi:hypothetical protein